jgi:hypothetical protein
MLRYSWLGGCAGLILCWLALTTYSQSPSDTALTPGALANCWQDLAADDAVLAYRTMS